MEVKEGGEVHKFPVVLRLMVCCAPGRLHPRGLAGGGRTGVGTGVRKIVRGRGGRGGSW